MMSSPTDVVQLELPLFSTIVKNLGGARTIKSFCTEFKMNRDLNAVRGIFLRALVDTPWLREHLNLCSC
jgi:putative transposase